MINDQRFLIFDLAQQKDRGADEGRPPSRPFSLLLVNFFSKPGFTIRVNFAVYAVCIQGRFFKGCV